MSKLNWMHQRNEWRKEIERLEALLHRTEDPSHYEAFAAAIPATPAGGGLTARDAPIAVLRRAFLASDGTLPDLIGHFCNEWNAALAASPVPAVEGLTQDVVKVWPASCAELHPHTVHLVVRFAQALAEKLAAAEKKYGYSVGWLSPDWMDECRAKLMEHVAKGDPRDVAAYCAFLWHHGQVTSKNGMTASPVPLSDTGAQEANNPLPWSPANRLANAIKAGDPGLNVADVQAVLSERAALLSALVDMREAWIEQFGESACDCRQEPENSGHMCQCCKSLAAIAKATNKDTP